MDISGTPRRDAAIMAAIAALQKELVHGEIQPVLLHYPTLIEACKELLILRKETK